MSRLRNKAIRLAYTNPRLRPHLLPLLRTLHTSTEIPTSGIRDYGVWFIKHSTITPLTPQSAMVHVVIESGRTAEVRTLSRMVDELPGSALKFQVYNMGGKEADDQHLVILATVDGNEVNDGGVARMQLDMDPVRGTWDPNKVGKWVW